MIAIEVLMRQSGDIEENLFREREGEGEGWKSISELRGVSEPFELQAVPFWRNLNPHIL